MTCERCSCREATVRLRVAHNVTLQCRPCARVGYDLAQSFGFVCSIEPIDAAQWVAS